MTLESRLATKLQYAWNDGCPVAGSSPEVWTEMAGVARRRWSSFERRNPHKTADQASRIEDLARGLCDRRESGGIRTAGPLISDYRWLAEQLAEVFECDRPESS